MAGFLDVFRQAGLRVAPVKDEENPKFLQVVGASLGGFTVQPRPEDFTDISRWAIVGTPSEVAEGIARYREELGMTHLIVRGHVPLTEPADLVRSLEILAGLDL